MAPLSKRVQSREDAEPEALEDDGISPASNKRARKGASPYDDPVLPTGYRNQSEDAQEALDATLLEHQPGAIVRVKLTNFVTYSAVEFFPGPSLNMVIGPNGTGKSTLVCAICIGLGYDPKVG